MSKDQGDDAKPPRKPRGRPRVGAELVITTVYLTREQQVLMRRLGGSAWLRQVIEQTVRDFFIVENPPR